MPMQSKNICKRKDCSLEGSFIKENCFRNITEKWFLSIAPQIKESTKNKYLNLLNSYILPELGTLPLDELTHSKVESMCNSLLLNGGKRKLGLSPKTVTDALSVVRNIIKYASQHGVYIPCEAQNIHIKRPSKEMRVLTLNEQSILYNYLYSNPTGHNMGILVCLFTGLRIGEICALRWEDISFRDQTIYIHHTMQRIQKASEQGKKTQIVITPPKSASSIRTIPIPDDLLKMLHQYKTTETGYFLTNSELTFMEPRILQYRFKRVLEILRIAPANYHTLRHTFATRCVELEFDIKSLSEILGHASVNITMNRYVHPSLELKKKNMQRLSTLLSIK